MQWVPPPLTITNIITTTWRLQLRLQLQFPLALILSSTYSTGGISEAFFFFIVIDIIISHYELTDWMIDWLIISSITAITVIITYNNCLSLSLSVTSLSLSVSRSAAVACFSLWLYVSLDMICFYLIWFFFGHYLLFFCLCFFSSKYCITVGPTVL